MTPLKSHKHNKYTSVTVLISVYNGDHTLNTALNSVFNQSFQDFVIVAINDASTDNSQDILEKWQSRFKPNQFTIINNKHNLGLTKSLNLGLKKCESKYIARIDADDIWSPNKLTLQVDFLQKNPSVGVIGSWYTNVTQYSYRNFNLPTTDTAIKRNIFRINPFGHSCVVIRKKLLNQISGYNPKIKYSQDRDLWFRLMKQTHFFNLPLYLCQRQNSNNISILKSRQQMWQSLKIRFYYANKYHASLYTYLFLILPLLIILKPRFLFTTKTQPQSHTTPKKYLHESLYKHNLLFVNDRPLIPHRAETIARQAMSKAFSSHQHIKNVTIANITPLQVFKTKRLSSYHVVYLRCGSLASAIIALRIFFSSQVLLLEVHNLDSNKINIIASMLYRLAAKRADLFIAIDPISRATWIKYGAPPTDVLELPSGAVTHKETSTSEKISILKKHSLPSNKKLIVYSGNLYRHRGIENILQAANSLKNKNFAFVLAGGSTDDIKYYKEYAQSNNSQLNNVYFLGHIPHSQVMPLLSIADLILVTYSKLCPTINTMSPIKLTEALSANNQILATDLPRIRTLSQKYTVNYYAPDDTQNLTHKITQLLSNTINKASLKSSLNFTWEDRANKILNKVMP